MAIDLLLSYAFHRRTDLARVKAALVPSGGLLMVDSGAFSVKNSGIQISLYEYATYLRYWQGVYDFAMNLDVIGDQAATDRNFVKLREQGLPVLPIYTARAPVAAFDALCEEHDYVGLGGMVGVRYGIALPATRSLVERAAARGARVHTLGQAGLDMFSRVRAYSGDSSAVSKAGWLAGKVGLFDPAQRKMTWPSIREPDTWRKHGELLRAYGLDARTCLVGEGIRSAPARAKLFRATILGFVLQGRMLRAERGADHPRLYTAVVVAEVLHAALALAAEWPTSELPTDLPLRLRVAA